MPRFLKDAKIWVLNPGDTFDSSQAEFRVSETMNTQGWTTYEFDDVTDEGAEFRYFCGDTDEWYDVDYGRGEYSCVLCVDFPVEEERCPECGHVLDDGDGCIHCGKRIQGEE